MDSALKARVAANVPKTLDNMRVFDPSMLTAKPKPAAPDPSSAVPEDDIPSASSSQSGSEAGSLSEDEDDENEHAADGIEASTSTPPAPDVELDDENAYDISNDPFASYFSSAFSAPTDENGDPIPPKVLITTSSKSTKVAFDFCEELVGVVPGSEFIRRKKNKGFEIGRVAGWASGRGYSSMMVVNEDRKKCSKWSFDAYFPRRMSG